MAIVRLLLFAALGIVVGALILYAVKRDRRYLRFVGHVAKYTVVVLLVILLGFAAQRIIGFSAPDWFRTGSSSARTPPPVGERGFERAVGKIIGEREQRRGAFAI